MFGVIKTLFNSTDTDLSNVYYENCMKIGIIKLMQLNKYNSLNFEILNKYSSENLNLRI